VHSEARIGMMMSRLRQQRVGIPSPSSITLGEMSLMGRLAGTSCETTFQVSCAEVVDHLVVVPLRAHRVWGRKRWLGRFDLVAGPVLAFSRFVSASGRDADEGRRDRGGRLRLHRQGSRRQQRTGAGHVGQGGLAIVCHFVLLWSREVEGFVTCDDHPAEPGAVMMSP